MKLAWIAALVSFLVCEPVASNDGKNYQMQLGADAIAVCKSIEDARSNLEASFVCLSWVNGAVQGAAITFSLEKEKPSYCTPDDGGSNQQYAEVFLKFLRDNPAKRHLPAIYLFHQAMAEAFPCNYANK